MRVLVTGGKGFLGRYVCAELTRRGHTVQALGRADCDITREDAVKRTLREHPADALLHLAALVHGADKDLSEENFHRINAVASENLFRHAAKNGIRRVVFASSVEVYGEQDVRRVDESAPCHPSSPYGRSKLEAERHLAALGDRFERWAALRLAPVYAPDFRLNVDKRFYLPKKLAAYYFKDGGYAFNFCAVGNVAEFVADFLEKEAPSGIYNISDRQSISAKEFIALEKENSGLTRVVRLPYGLCYALIACAEWILRRATRSEPFLSRYNFRKLFKSTVYDSAKAAEYSPLRHGVMDLY